MAAAGHRFFTPTLTILIMFIVMIIINMVCVGVLVALPNKD